MERICLSSACRRRSHAAHTAHPHDLQTASYATCLKHVSHAYTTIHLARTSFAIALPGTTTKGAGEAHFVAVPSSAKAGPTTVTAAAVVNPSSHVALKNAAKNGSFSVRASERSVHIIDGLACGDAYDVFFVIEVRLWRERFHEPEYLWGSDNLTRFLLSDLASLATSIAFGDDRLIS